LDEGIPSVVNFYPIDTMRRGGRLNGNNTSHSTPVAPVKISPCQVVPGSNSSWATYHDLEITVFWDVTPCALVDLLPRFGGGDGGLHSHQRENLKT
jgi:hypothetical protein